VLRTLPGKFKPTVKSNVTNEISTIIAMKSEKREKEKSEKHKTGRT